MSSATSGEKRLVERYLAEHEMQQVVNEVLNATLRERPDDPFSMLSLLLKEKAKAGKGIKEVRGSIVLDCTGKSAIQVLVRTAEGEFSSQVCLAPVTSGFYRVEPDEFMEVWPKFLVRELVDKDPTDMDAIDRELLRMDDSPDLAEVGANTIYAASIACFRAGAASKGEPLFRFLANYAQRKEFVLPVPWVILVELEQEQIGFVPVGCDSIAQAIEVIRMVSTEIAQKDIPPTTSLRAAIEIVLETLSEMELGEVVRISVSVRNDYLQTSQGDQGEGAENQLGEDEKEDAVEKEAEAEKSKSKGKGKGKGKSKKGEAAETSADQENPEAIVETPLAVVLHFLQDDIHKNAIAIVENLFSPTQKDEMSKFVEEHGDQVVLVNIHEPIDPEGGENNIVSAYEEPTEEGDAAEPKEEEMPSKDEASGLYPFNGVRLLAGVPFESVRTVSELVEECQTMQGMGLAVALACEGTQGSFDSFTAEFSVALSTGLVRVGSLSKAGDLLVLNALLRIEEQLDQEAFYAGTRFRGPF